jgi:hypothetical protein
VTWTGALIRPGMLLVLVLVLVGACASAGTQPLIGNAPLTKEIVERLLTKSDEEAIGIGVGELGRSVDDLLALASGIDPTVPLTTESLWSLRWSERGKPRLMITLTRFHQAPMAHAALEKIERGQAYHAMEVAIGDRSSLLSANSDTGAAVTFLRDRTLVALQLPITSDGAALLNEEQLIKLAILVDAKL